MSYTQIDRNMVVDFAPAPSTSSAPTYRGLFFYADDYGREGC